MIGPIVIQELITIDSATTTYRQATPVGVASLQDLVVTVDTRGVSAQGGTLTVFLDTSPDQDESHFVPMVTAGTTLTQNTVQTVKVLLTQADQPVQRWVRWRIVLTGGALPWSATFCIVAAGNPSGGR